MTRPAFADILNLAEPLQQIAEGREQAGENAPADPRDGTISNSIDAFIAKRRKRKRES